MMLQYNIKYIYILYLFMSLIEYQEWNKYIVCGVACK
jgi:hypothetical protein